MVFHKTKSVSVPSISTHELSAAEYQKIRNEYIESLTSKNPKIILSELREHIKTSNSLLRSCHSLTHEIGQAAYGKYKDFGVALEYQDEICNSGYLHGVIESRFLETSDIFATIQTICDKYNVEKYIGWECYHGIGHGVMYYTQNDMPRSLSLCDTFENRSMRSTCINGVFMENFNTDQKLHHSKYLKANDPAYPCKEQSAYDKADCYLYAPTYYLSLHKNDYLGALKWCNTVEQGFALICIRGVGSQAIKENIQDPFAVESICMSGDSQETYACISGMVGLYINHFGQIDEADELCDKLKPSNKPACEKAVQAGSRLFQS